MYQRAFSTLGCPEQHVDGILALARRHEVRVVEIRALGGTIDLPAGLASAFGAPSTLATRMRREPVRIAAFDTSFKLVGSTEAERAALLEHVPWAEALGARLRVFDGGRPDDPAGLDEMTATLAWWSGLRTRNGWRTDLMVETHDSLLTARAVRRLLERAPEARILWDAHHTWRKGGEDPRQTWQAIRGETVHIHVKDSVAEAGAPAGFRYCLPGDGEFPMAGLLEALRNDFAGPLSLEWERLWHPALPLIDDALRIAAKRNWW